MRFIPERACAEHQRKIVQCPVKSSSHVFSCPVERNMSIKHTAHHIKHIHFTKKIIKSNLKSNNYKQTNKINIKAEKKKKN